MSTTSNAEGSYTAPGPGLVERPSARAERVGALRPLVRRIRVPFAPQSGAIAVLDELRHSGLAMREQAHGDPMPGTRLIAEPGVGKTIAVEMLRARVKEAHGDEHDFRVLICRLDPSGSQASVPQSILKAAKKPRWDLGNPARLWSRAFDCIDEYRIELVAFDEIQRATRRPTISPAIVGDLHDLLDAGKAPVALIGNKTADTLFDAHPSFSERLDAPVDIGPLDWFVSDDRDIFVRLLRDLDAKYVELGLLKSTSDLDHPDVALKLWTATRGRIRLVARTLETALLAVVRERRHVISVQDLENAVDDYLLANRYLENNPFRKDAA